MKFDKILLDDIIPSDYNPRIMSEEDTAKLSKNLKEFGLVDPIIINLKNNHIIGGHQRYNVLRQKYGSDVDYENKELKLIKLGDIGWVFEESKLSIKDENHEKALNIALNKISGDWDWSKLNTLFHELQTTHFDMDLTGFDKIEISIPQIELPSFDEEEEEDEPEILISSEVEPETHETIISEPEDVILDEDAFDEDFENKFDLDLSFDEEESPEDEQTEVVGSIENKNYSIFISFLTQESANDFIEKHIKTDKRLSGNTLTLKEGKDFNKTG